MILSILFSFDYCTADVSTTCKQTKWTRFNDTLLTCAIENSKIHNQNVLISSSRNPSVDAVDIKNEVEIEFIPLNIAAKYPNHFAIQVFNCSIKSVSEYLFKQIPELIYLNLARNKIEIIQSKVFHSQTKLTYLSLGWNQIEFISPHAFRSLRNLKLLYLHDNKIQWISEDLFSGLNSVEYITLSDNRIKMLNWNALSGLNNIKNISFASNNIEEVKCNAIVKNVKVERIWLYKNQIKYLDPNIFIRMKNLIQLDLEDNTCINKIYNSSKSIEILKEIDSDFLVQRCGRPNDNIRFNFIENTTSEAEKLIFENKYFRSAAVFLGLLNLVLRQLQHIYVDR